MDDKELMAEAQRGNKEAFSELYTKYFPKITSFLERKFRFNGKAEDIAQESLIKAYKRLNLYSPESGCSVSSWLYLIAIRKAISETNKTKRRDHIYNPEYFTCKRLLENIGYEDKERSRIFEIDSLDMHLVIENIEMLNPKYKLPILYFYYGNKSYNDISEILNIPITSVKTRLHRAKKELKKMLPVGFSY